jgi:peptidoglycan-associated lipoprotein
MKTAAAALIQVVLAVVVIHASACSTTKAAAKAQSADDDFARKALIKELDALVAQGPLHFDTDTDTLTDESQVLLQKVAAQMHRVPKVKVIVGGHCDERGDDAYNLALGDKRAHAARDYLVRLGIPKERVRMVSFGEEQPIALGHDEIAWSQNRRDEFTFELPGEHKTALHMLDGKTVDEMASELVATTTWGNEQ